MKATAYAINGKFCDWNTGEEMDKNWAGTYAFKDAIFVSYIEAITGERVHVCAMPNKRALKPFINSSLTEEQQNLFENSTMLANR